MIILHLSNGTYRFSERAFAHRLMHIMNDHSWTTLAQAQAAVTALPFTAVGWRNLKKVLAELLLGSVAFPDENQNGGTTSTLTDDQVATRDIAGGVT